MQQIVSSAHIRHRLNADYGHEGGRARLARLLSVSHFTATSMLQGSTQASLIKGAALYGFEPGDYPDEWRKVARSLDPKKAGYRRWKGQLLEDVSRELAKGRSVASVANQFGLTEIRIRRALSRHQLTLAILRKGDRS